MENSWDRIMSLLLSGWEPSVFENVPRGGFDVMLSRISAFPTYETIHLPTDYVLEILNEPNTHAIAALKDKLLKKCLDEAKHVT